MGGTTKTQSTTTQQPPQMSPESREGYIAGSDYYKGILGAPPIYSGDRVAGFAPGQEEAMRQAYDFFSKEQPYMTAAKDQVGRTASGGYDYMNPRFMGYDPAAYKGINDKYDYDAYKGINAKYDYTGIGGGGGASGGGSFGGFGALPGKYEYSPETTKYGSYDANVVSPDSKYDWQTGPQWSKMDDPEMQRQISAASEPIMAQLQEEVLPGIRSSGSLAGQGGTSTRGDVARQQAVEGFGRTVGDAVIAPLIMQQSQLEQDYTKAIQEMNRATMEGDADRAARASIAAESIQQQSWDVTNQVNQQRAEADATNKGRYASDWMQQQTAGEGIKAQYADTASRASIASMQDITDRAIADAQVRLGYADRDSQNRIADAENRLGYAGLDTGTQLAYDRLGQEGRLGYDQLMQGAYGSERDRQLLAAGMAPDMDKATAQRIASLNLYGAQDQTQRQRELDAMKEAFEEPIFRQSTAADALMRGAQVGPGGSETKTRATQDRDWISTILQVAQVAASIYAACSETMKADIVDVPDPDGLINDVLNLSIKEWRYKWDEGGVKRLGPILEQSPDWLKASDRTINILSLVSALVLIAQSQNKRIIALEEKCSSK